MSNPRLASLPFDHMEAEMAAFPLASEACFELGLTGLDLRISRNDRLWRAAERQFVANFPALPLDEMLTLRDRLWFRSVAREGEGEVEAFNLDWKLTHPVAMGIFLKRLADSYLDHSGDLRIASEKGGRDHTGALARLRWSWMCRALPPDLLRATRGLADPDGDALPLSPSMQCTLQEKGFAEIHVHLGADLDFPLCWAGLMRRLTSLETRYDEFKSPGACFRDGHELGAWLMHAAVVRLVLAEWLFDGPSEDFTTRGILDVLNRRRQRPGTALDIVQRNRLMAICDELAHGRWQDRGSPGIGTRLHERFTRRYALTRGLYRRLIRTGSERDRDGIGGPRRIALAKSRAETYAADPLATISGWQANLVQSPESLFIAKALHRLREQPNSDAARLFWQMTRVRCLLYRHVVQRPQTPGLQWFVRFYERIKPLRSGIDQNLLVQEAANTSGARSGLRSLEIRQGTSTSVTSYLYDVRRLEKAAQLDRRGPEFRFFRPAASPDDLRKPAKFEAGVVFHFVRRRGGGWHAGKLNAYGLDHSYPGTLRTGGAKPLENTGNTSGFRFARFYLEQRRHAQALVSLLRKFPQALRTVRGVDLCNDEAGVPLWVMAPLVSWVKAAGESAREVLVKRRRHCIPGLRATMHAGEDFVHLLTGLRLLDETVSHLHLREGDRLGHALALGIKPKSWCNLTGRVVLTREKRLFDLIWEYRCYAEGRAAAPRDRATHVRHEIARLAHSIFAHSYPPEVMMGFVDLLYRPRELKAIGFPDKPYKRPRSRKARKSRRHELLQQYLCDEAVWRRGRQSEVVDLGMSAEWQALQVLQRELRRKVGRLGLVIEINPSSNLLVGNLGNYQQHPLWRLRPVTRKKNSFPLSVCIGSDDPLTFATSLPHEYQFIYDALILRGHSHDQAEEWIEAAREAGMRSRFTLPEEVADTSEKLTTPNLLGWSRPESPP